MLQAHDIEPTITSTQHALTFLGPLNGVSTPWLLAAITHFSGLTSPEETSLMPLSRVNALLL